MRKFTNFLSLTMAFVLMATVAFAQQKETVIVPKGAEAGRAVGDDITNPMVVDQANLPFSESATTCGAVNDYSDTDMGFYDGGEDYIYQLNLTEAATIKITMTPGGTWSGVGLFPGTDTPENTVAIATETASSTTDRVIQEALAAGSYYIMVDTWPSPTCIPFDMAIEAVIPAYAPENLVAELDGASTPGNAKIDLTWEAGVNDPANVVEYKVYRKVEGGAYAEIAAVAATSYSDETAVDNETYTYKVTAVTASEESDDSNEVTVTAFVEPGFAMDPESFDFDRVGLLNGNVFYGADNAEFTVTNAGVGTLTVDEAPYTFSQQLDQFNVLDGGAAYPVDLDGPASSTNEEFTFEVEFVPTASGEFSTLLVVNTDEIRTFTLTGSAYDIPDYDLVENAYEIVNDWNINFDYDVAANDFADFYNDYDLTVATDNDVVYYTTITKDSYIEFTNASGVADFAMFTAGDAIVEANNIYEDGQTAIVPGTYYIVVSGAAAYDFDVHVEGQDPILSVTPDPMTLGEVPIGAWHPGGVFTIANIGGQSLEILNVTTSDENNVFSVEGHYEYPATVTTNELTFIVTLDADVPGFYEGALLVEDETTTHIYEISGTAYQPVEGDVVELAYDIANTTNYAHSASVVNPPMRNNYILDNSNVTDVVYGFSYPTDGILTATLADTLAGFNGMMQLYDMSDVRSFANPNNVTPIAEGTEFVDLELWQGDYMIVLSGNPLVPAYTLNMNIVDMPAPAAVTLVAPVDGSDDVSVEPELSWTVGDYTNSVNVYLDTQYPPVTMVTQLDAAQNTYTPETLDPAQIYFWKVVAVNENGMTESETWAFTTMLPPPLFVTGEIYDFTNVHLEWNDPYDNSIGWIETFEESGEEIPDGWTMTTNGTGSSAGWFVTADGASSYFDVPSHTTYAISNDDANNGDGSMDYLITPEVDLSSGEEAKLIFDSFYNGAYGQVATVEISTDGGSTWTTIQTMEASDAWVEGFEVSLNDYIGADYAETLIAFHSDDTGAWASGWAIDNVEFEVSYPGAWANRDFLGYYVYQDGVVISGDDAITETEYDVTDLTCGDYVFGVSAVYNEGESEVVTIEAITILGRGTVAGTATDADSGAGIDGATITFTANELIGVTYTASTDASGNYSIVLPVVDGGYTAVAAHADYADVEMDATPVCNVTVDVDFVMGEVPMPATNVVAIAADDDQSVTVTWDLQSEYPTYEIVYDDNTAENATAWNSTGFMNALKITPSGYPALVKGASINIYSGSWPAGNILTAMEIVVLDDDGANGLPGTELGTIEVTPTDYNWVDVDLSSLNISIADGDFYIAHRQINTYPDCPPTAIDEDNPVGRSYAYDASAGTWDVASYDTFMIRATISGPQGTETLGHQEVVVDGNVNAAAVSVNPTALAAGTYTQGEGAINVIAEGAIDNSREIQNFEIYRFAEEDMADMASWTLLGTTTETSYVDGTWADAEMGVYYFAVKVIYTVTESDPAISNMVAKDMISNAIVIVELNTGDSPEGAEVLFTNLDNDTTYTAVCGADGTVQFMNFWKGNYDLTVSLENYDTYLEEDIEIIESAFIRNILLKETLAIPTNLTATVDCKDVTVTWEAGTTGGGTGGSADEFAEDFEAGIPADWTFVDADGDSYGWDWSDEFTANSGIACMYSASYDNTAGALNPDNYMITPALAIGSGSELSFSYIAQDTDWPGDKVYVKVSTTDNSVASFTETVATVISGTSYTVESIDLSAYAGQTIYVAFNHADCSDYFYINIDDVTLTSATRANEAAGYIASTVDTDPIRTSEMSAQEAADAIAAYFANNSRALTGYNVYRDGSLIATTEANVTEYVDEDLAGGTYAYSVDAIFTTGTSAVAGPVEATVADIVAPENLTGELMSNNNVELYWDEVTADGFVGFNVYRNDEMIAEEITDNMFIDYDMASGEFTYYVVAVYAEGCVSEASNEVTFTVAVGINQIANSINVYPNPTRDNLTIEVSNNIETIAIINYVGQVVYTNSVDGQDAVNVSTSNSEAGSYIVQFTTNNGERVNKRFIVVK